MTSFEEIFVLRKNYCILTKMRVFSLLKRKIKICDRAMKLDSLGNCVPLYFSLNFTLPLFAGAIVELGNSVFCYF